MCDQARQYDVDNDGRISLYDLKTALELQYGRSYNVTNTAGEDYTALCSWISQRDTSNTGYVSYTDFVNYYTSN